jgi:hypothetical protein
MRHTLKAIFDKRSDAQHLLDKLLASGYKHADPTTADTGHDEDFGASVRHTISRIFGKQHHEDPAPPQDDSADAQHVVTLTSESEPDAKRAARIIENADPNDIEEHHEHSNPDTVGTYVPGVATAITSAPRTPKRRLPATRFRRG